MRFGVLPCVLLAAVGCTRGLIEYTGGADGARYSVEGTSMHLTEASGSLVIRKDGHELRSAGGRLTLDGRDAGKVAAGDHVVFTRDNRLVVNSTEREAVAAR